MMAYKQNPFAVAGGFFLSKALAKPYFLWYNDPNENHVVLLPKTVPKTIIPYFLTKKIVV